MEHLALGIGSSLGLDLEHSFSLLLVGFELVNLLFLHCKVLLSVGLLVFEYYFLLLVIISLFHLLLHPKNLMLTNLKLE